MAFTSHRSRMITGLVFDNGDGVDIPLAAQEADPEEARGSGDCRPGFVTVAGKESATRQRALDKVYGFHVERGSLAGLIKTYRDKGGTPPGGTEAGAAWMIVGLLEVAARSRRRRR